jgi:hypothetical protein
MAPLKRVLISKGTGPQGSASGEAGPAGHKNIEAEAASATEPGTRTGADASRQSKNEPDRGEELSTPPTLDAEDTAQTLGDETMGSEAGSPTRRSLRELNKKVSNSDAAAKARKKSQSKVKGHKGAETHSRVKESSMAPADANSSERPPHPRQGGESTHARQGSNSSQVISNGIKASSQAKDPRRRTASKDTPVDDVGQPGEMSTHSGCGPNRFSC